MFHDAKNARGLHYNHEFHLVVVFTFIRCDSSEQ